MNRNLWILVGVALLSSAFGCGSDGGDHANAAGGVDGNEPAIGTPSQRVSPERLHGVPLAALDRGVVERLAAGSSDYQRQIFEDGRVDIAEYERAMLAYVECLEERGATVKGDLSINRVGLILPTIKSSGENHEKVTNALAECDAKYTREVKMLWAIVTEPLVEEASVEFRKWATECLVAAGLVPEDRPWDSEDPETNAIVASCIRAAQERFDTGPLSFGFAGDGRGP